MKWTIDKSFDFCYGHRVHNQRLDTNFTENNDGCLACRHLHGHQGKIKVFLESSILKSGMVTDFKHLGWFKQFIDDTLDHKFIMDLSDPLCPHELPDLCVNDTGSVIQEVNKSLLMPAKDVLTNTIFWTPDMSKLNLNNQAVYEKYEGLVLVDFVPTSENICSWLLGIANNRMKELDVVVTALEFWETPKSHCRVDWTHEV
jgi:6-pyruvoyltetrahydropterin/6-carboxytetrahydropterin synthase